MNLQVSGVTGKEDKKVYLNFDDGDKAAEIRLPDCSILSNKGFNQEELKQLKDYAEVNQKELWEQAKLVDPMKAFLG
ncbi:MAG: hypothetical protein PHS74_11900 [Lachnospiraceae bacterium]|nr:hypothetical protein [Lachnospiraceae bacterium]